MDEFKHVHGLNFKYLLQISRNDSKREGWLVKIMKRGYSEWSSKVGNKLGEKAGKIIGHDESKKKRNEDIWKSEEIPIINLVLSQMEDKWEMWNSQVYDFPPV